MNMPCKDCLVYPACKQTIEQMMIKGVGQLARIKKCNRLAWYLDTLAVSDENQLKRINKTRRLFGLNEVHVW